MRVLSERGAVSIILVAIILTIMFVIGISASAVRLKRLRFANQNITVIRTEEAVKMVTDFMRQSVIDNFYILGNSGDCGAGSGWWPISLSPEIEYCLTDFGLVQHPRYPGTEPDARKFELKVRLLGKDIVQSVILFLKEDGTFLL